MTWDPRDWHDPTFKVLVAQALNLSRIHAGDVLTGTDDDGNPLVFVGNAPDVIRLYDTPKRLMEETQFIDAGYQVILAPATDQPVDRIATRSGRAVSYAVNLIVKLTDDEIAQDAESKGTTNILARKIDKALWDFRIAFFDNMHLADENCTGGYVDDGDFAVEFDNAQYPYAVARILARGSLITLGFVT